MTTKTRKQLFINFLKENNALLPFMILLANNNQTLNQVCTEKYPILEIKNWNGKETWDYWNDIDDEWTDYIDLYSDSISFPTPSKPRRPKKQQQFIDFLKENDALIPYCCNIASKGVTFWSQENGGVQTLSQACDPFNNWTNNFMWDKSTEGHEFWKNIDDKWNKLQ